MALNALSKHYAPKEKPHFVHASVSAEDQIRILTRIHCVQFNNNYVNPLGVNNM